MNYIKKFESLSDISDVVGDIRFILSDLSDLGFYVVVGEMGDVIRVFIQGPETKYSVSGARDHESFNASIYKEYDLRIKDYLDNKLFNTSYTAFSYTSSEKSNSFDDMLNIDNGSFVRGVIEEELVCDYELY